MPRQSLTLEQCENKANSILSKYNNDISVLKEERNKYRCTKDPKLLIHYNQYLNLCRYQRQIKELKKPPQDLSNIMVSNKKVNKTSSTNINDSKIENQNILNTTTTNNNNNNNSNNNINIHCNNDDNNDDGVNDGMRVYVNDDTDDSVDDGMDDDLDDHGNDDINDVNNNTNEHNTISLCMNCNRREIAVIDCSVARIQQQRQRKFKLININEHEESVRLCQNCYLHLTVTNKKEANKEKHCWPAFVWSFLTNETILQHYDSSDLWKFIPKKWRHWWITSFTEQVDNSVSIDNPKPFFIDRTDDVSQWNTKILSYNLGELRDICNQLLFPNVLCPYGCSCFIHRSGSVSFDLIIQRYLPKCIIRKIYSNKKGFDHLLTTRDDFLRNKYDRWLLNDEWMVVPTLTFIDDVPYVLTCDDHDKGTKSLFVHPPRSPSMFENLSSKYSDQLTHCVVRPRSLRPMQKKYFSNSYQMNEQRGCFNGVDTCNLTTFRRFDINSTLLSIAEATSIYNRPDINSLMNNLVEEGKMSKFIVEQKREYSKNICDSVDFNQYTYGSTYIPFVVSTLMQRDITNNSLITVTLDDRGGNLPSIQVKYRKCWPTVLHRVQNTTKHGGRFASIPKLSLKVSQCITQTKIELVWVLCSILLSNQTLWSAVENTPLFKSKWHGWMLMYLTKNCLIERNYCSNKEVFKTNEIRTLERFFNDKLRFTSMREAFSDVLPVAYIYMNDDNFNHDDVSFNNNVLNQVTAESVLSKNVIICDNVRLNHFNRTMEEVLIVHQVKFELRCISSIFNVNTNKFDGEVFARHGGYHNLWWYQKRSDYIRTQVDNIENKLRVDGTYILVYCKAEDIDVNAMRDEYLQYIGGQHKAKCAIHQQSLVQSLNKKVKCSNCNSDYEYYTCPFLNCNSCICRRCWNNINDNGPLQFLQCNDDNDVESDNDDDTSVDSNVSTSSNSNYNDNDTDGDYLFHDNNQNNCNDNDHGNNNNNTRHDGGFILEPDDFDDYLTTPNDPDIVDTNNNNDDNTQLWDSTNAGEFPFVVQSDDVEMKGAKRDVTISGHTILNQCGALLTRKKHLIKGNKKQKFMIQKLCATSCGNTVPLMYPEAMLFPSIFWTMADDGCSIVGAIPSPLLSELTQKFGFATLSDHTRSRITNPSLHCSTNANYISYSFDQLTNQVANHQDTRIILRRGLTVDTSNAGELGLRGTGDSSMLESFDSKAMVRNLCASQRYHEMTHFLTFTCNQRKHFGTKPIKEWLDSDEWKKQIPFYNDLPETDKNEIEESVNQAASGLLVRVWQEVTQLFLNYLKKSPSSPYIDVKSMFTRQEYQALMGNLHHLHLILEVNRAEMTDEQRQFIDDLARCSIFDIVRIEEVESLINDGTFKNFDDYRDMQRDATKFLPHICNSRCLAIDANGNYYCRKLDNLKVTKDNTKHTFQEFNNEIPNDCLCKLIEIGMVEEGETNEHGWTMPWKSKLPFLHPRRHIPPTNPNDDLNMSPVEGYTFSVCRSMQNIQVLTQSGGVNKYVCKYIGKIDENNYIVIFSNGLVGLLTKSTFLHNTKVSSSKHAEDKERKKYDNYPQGRCISHVEMIHQMLKYPEVITDLVFVQVSTMPLEYRAGIEVDDFVATSDGAQSGCVANDIRLRMLGLQQWRQHTANELLIYEDLTKSKVSIDKITLFSLRPPELRKLINETRQYFRWFHTVLNKSKKVSGDQLVEKLNDDLSKSWWVNCLQQKVLVRRRAFPELMAYIESLNEIRDEGVQEMIALFQRMNRLLHQQDEFNENDIIFYNFMMKNLIHDDSEIAQHLPVPVFSYIKPTSGLQFIHHILLSMGKFDTEIDIVMQPSIRESFRYCQLIGPSNDVEDLQRYSNNILYKWIEEQLQFFPNSKRVICEWIVIAGELFDSVIVRDEFAIADMPPVQLTSLFGSNENDIKDYFLSLKSNFVDAIYEELTMTTVTACNIPSKTQLLSATKTNPFNWDAYDNFVQSEVQSDASYDEQKTVIELCCRQIDKYVSLSHQCTHTKNVGIRGFPGSGKTWCSFYVATYALSKGLFVLPTALLAKRANQLGGKHWHKLFCIPTERNLSVHRRAEMALINILKNEKAKQILLSLDVLVCDEIGQLADNFIASIDIIMRRLRNNSLYLGGLLIICTLDHTQIQAIDGRPLLTSSNIIPMYKMLALEHSVRAANDPAFYRIQQISRYTVKTLLDNPQLINEFRQLCGDNLTFVNDWNDPSIPTNTIRLYSKNNPVREATKEFAVRVRRHYHPNNIREVTAEDVEKSRYSQQDWRLASDQSVLQLDNKAKEPKTLLFFCGCIYLCTFNDSNGHFNQAQMALLYDLPTHDQLINWQKIKVLVAPPGTKDIVYNENCTKESYINIGFKEVSIGVTPQYNHALSDNGLGRRKQYGLKHYVSNTIHGAMGDTLPFMATQISCNDSNFSIWDKGQLVVILSRTNYAKNSIFVGPKNNTLDALTQLLVKKTQWTDYIDKVLDLVTINGIRGERNNNVNHESNEQILFHDTYPFRICDTQLPTVANGYVYMLVSLRFPNFSYIGTTKCIRTRLQMHNSGNGAEETSPAYLRPFALMAYICGFSSSDSSLLRYSIEGRWKVRRDYLISQGDNNVTSWARCGNDVINNHITDDEYQLHGVERSELRLVCLFESNDVDG